MSRTADIVNEATRVLFFTGKGGVGKTSLACATALALADRGKRVLLVSTDPASNLDEVLGTHLGSTPTAVGGASGLFALNIDPDEAAQNYRENLVGPFRGVLPEDAIVSMEEQLSGACTVEIAAFDQFTRLLADPAATDGYDHVLFDTAPTGHTLRLLKLPAAWTGFMASSITGTSCLGPLSGLQNQRSLYEASLNALTDPSTTTLILVARPEPSALTEAERTRRELRAMGIARQVLVVNGVFVASTPGDQAATALEARGRQALAAMPEELAALPRIEVPLLAFAPIGVPALRHVFDPSRPAVPAGSALGEQRHGGFGSSLSALVDKIESAGRGVVMTMGKGGVGKTTVAAAIAAELAYRGHRVHLSTTDPAAHLTAALDGEIPSLRVSRIDPIAEVRTYSEEVLAGAGAGLDAQGRALLEEDLRSPCTEEIAVFRAFASTVAEGENGFVVLDTAPTGHTLLLLDAAEAYHREVSRTLGSGPEAVRRLLPRLRDPEFTRVLMVTLPEATAVHEAARLQDDLRRAGIEPFAWVVNQSFSGSRFHDPVLVERGLRELPYLSEVHQQLAQHVALISWKAQVPKGPVRLRELVKHSVELK
ncbi:MAG: arsenical pump-driving ATPase [Acidobacteriota bacterium]